MTTETTETTGTTPRGHDGVAGVLLGTAGAALVAGLVVSLVAALVDGSPGAFGALAGTALVVGVFALGSLAVNLVARLMPSAALLVAMVTYTLQVVVMAMVLTVLRRSDLLDSAWSAGWLAGAVIVGTVVWMVSQIVLTTRLRLPVYDLRSGHDQAGAR